MRRATRAGVADFADRLRLAPLAGICVAPQFEIAGVEASGADTGNDHMERAARRDVVHHLLAGIERDSFLTNL